MITKTFKGASDWAGTFAYMENNELVIGENAHDKVAYTFRGSLEAFRNSRDYLKLAARNQPLLDDINYYYNYVYKPKKNSEDATMNNTEALIGRLTKHSDDYYKQKTQDFEQVAKDDCLAAADKLYMYSNSEITDKLSAGSGVESRSTRTTKLCEIKVTEGADSLKELVYQLTANGYIVQSSPVWKEFPKTGLDYWMIAIFDKEEKQ